jgi:murein tripeptide amidase MpaA
MEINFNEYFLYEELTQHLHHLAEGAPGLARLESIGQSWQGRDVWCMTITNSQTGQHDEKPAFYIDAHIHAEEVASSHTAMYTIWYLLTNYGSEAEVTWLLDHITFYIIPRVNPDGAEISLTTGHHWCGNGRYRPGEEQTKGLCQHDINGDGLIVQMRIEDPAGEWKVHPDDARLMILRKPGEVVTGPYYRMYPEGMIRGEWDGINIEIEKPRDGNMNRNYPAGWRPESRQYGAGNYPLSEPEILACAKFILEHPNISGMQAYHTHGGLHLRPSLVEPDHSIPPVDLALFNRIGEMGTELTGYPVISVYEEFTPDPDKPRVGSLMQWSYDEFGIITFSTELWNPELAAGIENPAKYQIGERSVENELKLLEYNDEHLGGKGFVEWMHFDHPQLGEVEIGGWTHMYTFRNPPPASIANTEQARNFLPEMIHTNTLFTLRHAACAPLLSIENCTAELLSEGTYKVTAVIENHGFLPTFMTERALHRGTADTVKVSLEFGENVQLLVGEQCADIGPLAGRDERSATWSPWLRQRSRTKHKVEWLVRAAAGTQLTIIARANRAGTKREQITCGS